MTRKVEGQVIKEEGKGVDERKMRGGIECDAQTRFE